ncbi:GxxExxY protein [Algoriphagus sp. A40]|uniref:GxxExxY protein n=1 Tax=Algoriphagus sp. A40 TaxID=1945863 RepID=UPI000986EA47|nr:GxxExxY protein [Algoriphagus sp. A40]OOG70631.1 GxxExxY protein [Algoriphagus sp. A40]
MNHTKPTDFEEQIGTVVVHAAFTVHKDLGPGLLERIYEVCMEHELKKAGFEVKRQVNIPISYDGIWFDEGLRLDLLVNDRVIVELKAVDVVNPVWEAQIISHLKLSKLNLGYLINFNVPIIKKGIRRFVNT